MTIKKSTPYLLAGLLVAAYILSQATFKEEPIHGDTVRSQSDTLKNDLEYYTFMTPKEFTPISFLDLVDAENTKYPDMNFITMTDNFPIDWVKSSDVDTLISLLKSTRKCRCFKDPLSSYIPWNDSADIGGYAVMFIDSYRHKTKIEMGLWKCPKTDTRSVEEIAMWYARYRKSK